MKIRMNVKINKTKIKSKHDNKVHINITMN